MSHLLTSQLVTYHITTCARPPLSGYYRVYQLISQPFFIAVRKAVTVISSIGIDLFAVTIIAVYKRDISISQRRLQDGDGSHREVVCRYTLVLLTETAEYLMLKKGTLLSNPSGYTMVVGNDGFDISGGCFTSGSLCLQLYTLETELMGCPNELDGTYALQFFIGCNPAVNGYDNAIANCHEYIDKYSNITGGGTTGAVSANLDWSDSVCDPLVYVIDFDSEMTFYADDQFESVITENYQYGLGDRVYVQV